MFAPNVGVVERAKLGDNDFMCLTAAMQSLSS